MRPTQTYKPTDTAKTTLITAQMASRNDRSAVDKPPDPIEVPGDDEPLLQSASRPSPELAKRRWWECALAIVLILTGTARNPHRFLSCWPPCCQTNYAGGMKPNTCQHCNAGVAQLAFAVLWPGDIVGIALGAVATLVGVLLGAAWLPQPPPSGVIFGCTCSACNIRTGRGHGTAAHCSIALLVAPLKEAA